MTTVGSRAGLVATALAGAAVALSSASSALAEGGVPFEGTGEEPPEGAVWDLSEPFWMFFAQERLLAPETPFGEALPRLAFAHIRPAGDEGRLFFILAGIAYLGLYHTEVESLELEASLFTMLVPVGSNVYRDGREVETEGFENSWTDMSFRARQTWQVEPPGRADPVRLRIGGEYQFASRKYVEGEETDPPPGFVLPGDTSVHTLDASLIVDARGRGGAGDWARGFELELGATREVRTDWNAWGPDVAGAPEYADPDAERATTYYGSLEMHTGLGGEGGGGDYVLHSKLRFGSGRDLDRLTYIRLGGGGFGRQFDRVGAGSTGAANDGELFRSDGVPGYFGGEYMTDEYAQINFELDVPGRFDPATGSGSRMHVSAAYASFRDVLDGGEWKELLGFGVGYTRVFSMMKSAVRLDLGYSPRPDGAFADSGDVTFTYLRKF